MNSINSDELKNKLDNREKITIIDVRNPQELSRGRIENSINVPLDNFDFEIEVKVPDKNAQIYLYCLSGSRSIIAAQIMEKLGYKNVFNLTHGLLEWRIKKLPLV